MLINIAFAALVSCALVQSLPLNGPDGSDSPVVTGPAPANTDNGSAKSIDNSFGMASIAGSSSGSGFAMIGARTDNSGRSHYDMTANAGGRMTGSLGVTSGSNSPKVNGPAATGAGTDLVKVIDNLFGAVGIQSSLSDSGYVVIGPGAFNIGSGSSHIAVTADASGHLTGVFNVAGSSQAPSVTGPVAAVAGTDFAKLIDNLFGTADINSGFSGSGYAVIGAGPVDNGSGFLQYAVTADVGGQVSGGVGLTSGSAGPGYPELEAASTGIDSASSKDGSVATSATASGSFNSGYAVTGTGTTDNSSGSPHLAVTADVSSNANGVLGPGSSSVSPRNSGLRATGTANELSGSSSTEMKADITF